MTIKNKILEYIQKHSEVDEKIIFDIAQRASSYDDLRRLTLENKIIKEEELLLLFSQEFRIPYLDLKRYKISSQNKNIISQDVAFKYKILPLCKIGKVITLVVSVPLDVIAYDDVKILSGAEKVDLVLSKEEDVMKALNLLYKTQQEDITKVLENKDISGVETNEEAIKPTEDLENLISESKRPPIVRALDLIIFNALKKRASDIHIEPYEDKLLVKYRVDGILHEEFSFPKKNQQAVIARLKIISSLDITESRLPQDGRFRVTFENREIDFRVSSLPANFGEKFVLRTLDKESLSIGLDKLGFSKKPLELFEEAVKRPFGIILVTGPTGSGKSTTLYSVINQMNTPDINIITIEDPVEYRLEGITQIQVNHEIGLTFAAGLHSVLRQSPDVIMVGEIRDSETADIAIKASLTGELIFSTLHTNSSVGAITRLKDMGTEPFLLASSLIASTAQRLARKLCVKCREKYTIDADTMKRLEIEEFCKVHGDVKQFFRAKGCNHCNQSGYRGRIALLEIILIDDTIKEMIIEARSEGQIVDYAIKNVGFRPLKEDGLSKCIEGITSIEEIMRITTE